VIENMKNYGTEAKAMKPSPYYPSAESHTEADRRRERQIVYSIMKKCVDILGALLGILLCIPVFILVGMLLKLEHPKGSIFFKQTRVGKNGKLFTMYKFRSMVDNAEQILGELLEKNEIQGAMFKMKDDPRVTMTGKFIRKTSIDELPQLYNVLKGDMSLVGPRPSLPREVALYTPYDKQRLAVIPGCTGLWQVSGRNALTFEQMVELDLHYIKHRSIWLDLKLILKTFWVIIFPNNAY
jgi:lipopolysaccharide/colanic/teichoic acid biosynthesis glycosyltransferase